jgi:fructose 5-dehydrogenase small subunit
VRAVDVRSSRAATYVEWRIPQLQIPGSKFKVAPQNAFAAPHPQLSVGNDMERPVRDDCPPILNLARRSFLAGSAIFVGGLASSTHVMGANAPTTLSAAKFMEISSLLIDHKLDSVVGERLAVAMSGINPGIVQDVDQILEIAHKNRAKVVEDFFPELPEGRLKETTLAIISAWYTGVVADERGATVFAYESALMYQPTSDVMTIPSYAISGPNGWSQSAPPLTDMPKF